MVSEGRRCSPRRRRRAMTAFVLNTDDAIVSRFFAVISVHWCSSAVETHVFWPFSVSLTRRSVHRDSSLVHLLRPGLRTSFRAEPGFRRARMPVLFQNQSRHSSGSTLFSQSRADGRIRMIRLPRFCAAKKDCRHGGLTPSRSPGFSYRTSMVSPANRSVITSLTARKYQSVPVPPVSTSSSPASLTTLVLAFRETSGLSTPARRLTIRVE